MSKIELIDANALYSEVVRKTIINFKPFDTWFSGYAHAMAEVEELINDAPIIYPVKHAYWIHEHLPSTNGGTYAVVRCSECKSQFPMWETKYCPDCGAKMDKENRK